VVVRNLQLAFLTGVCLWGQAPVTIEGKATDRDSSTYRMLPFEAPQGAKRVDVELSFTGRDRGVAMSLGIFDPTMFRGAGRNSFTIAEYDATPPFSMGPIVPGKWNILLGIGHVPQGVTSDYTVRVAFSNSDDKATGLVIRSGAGWYKGDLHSHTGHSDGVCYSQSGKSIPCPAHRLIEAAAARGLDFLAVTDHNTASTLNQIREMQPYFDKILLIHGREITTMNGHANVWGTAEFLDFRIGFNGWRVNDFLDQVHRANGVISINHAYWPTGAECPGCGWGWKAQTDFAKVDAIEALNGYGEKGSYFTPPAGATGIPFWEEQVARGLHPTAVGGGDDHRAGEQLPLGVGVGTPTTVVYASELSEPAILEGVRKGHVVIQRGGPDGPFLMLTAGQAIPGDSIAASGKDVTFSVRSERCGGCRVALFLDGKQQPSAPLNGDVGVYIAPGRHWVRAELRNASDEVVAMTNPIYCNDGR